MQYVYLHGFASGPNSRKAQFLKENLSRHGIQLEAPELAPDFHQLTISSQLAIIEAVVNKQPAVLIGSSLGGYLACLYAARHLHINRLVLLAPAFNFYELFRRQLGSRKLDHWKETGNLPVYHYAMNRQSSIGYQLMADAEQYEPFPDVKQPCLIMHGRKDIVVPYGASEQFAAVHSNTTRLVVLESGHELTDVLDEIWNFSRIFLSLNGTK